MASATAPKVAHTYDPTDEETITDKDGLVEIIITDRTRWIQLCDKNQSISNTEYQSLFDDSVVYEDCKDCYKLMIEEDPYGFIYDV